MHLEGSCHCGAVRFSVESPWPYPYLHCYCSICRKTAGAGGYAANIGALNDTLRIRGRQHIGIYHAVMREPGKRARRSPMERHFCTKCGSALWIRTPDEPERIYPHASAIDTPLPRPPQIVEAELDSAASWVEVPSGKGHVHCAQWPEETLAQWHRRHGLEQR